MFRNGCLLYKMKPNLKVTQENEQTTQPNPIPELCNSFRHVFLTYGGFILMFQRILLWIHELLEFTQVQKVVTIFCCNSNNSFDLKHYANMDGGNKWMLGLFGVKCILWTRAEQNITQQTKCTTRTLDNDYVKGQMLHCVILLLVKRWSKSQRRHLLFIILC